MSAYRLAAALSFLTMAGAMVYAHTTGQLFPGFPLGVFVALAILFGNELRHGTERGPPSVGWRVLPFITVAVTYRAFVFAFPATLPGVDPPRYATAISGVIQTGDVRSIEIFFYSQAPLSISYSAMLGIVTGAPGSQAIGLYPVILGLVTPAVVAALTARLVRSESRLKTVFAAGLAVATTGSVKLAVWPIPQSLGVAYWIVLLLIVARFLEVGSKRLLFLGVLTLVAQVYTHKLPLMIILGTVTMLAVASRLVVYLGTDDDSPVTGTDELILVGLICTLLALQWTFVTDLIRIVVFRSQRLLFTSGVAVTPPPSLSVTPTKAEPPPAGIQGILVRQGNWIVLLALGGIAWLATAYRRFEDRSVWFLLASIAIPVSLLLLSVIRGAGPPPLRSASFFEPALIPVLIVGLGIGLVRGSASRVPSSVVTSTPSLPPTRTWLTGLCILLVILLQLFSPGTVLDLPTENRVYLNEREQGAKSFGYQHVDGQIHSDWFVQVSGPPDCETFRNGSTLTCIPEDGPDSEQTKYLGLGVPLLNGTVAAQGHEHVLYRTDVEYFRTNGGVWRLLWDPERQMDADYNRVYANGGAVLHDRATGTTPVASTNTTG